VPPERPLDAHTEAAGNFSRTAKDYDRGVRFNVDGAWRLAATFPMGAYPRLLDVGCGTGWAAMAMVERFGCRHVTGVDPAQGMLDVFAEKLGALEGVEVELRAEDVVGMTVEPGSYDAVISSMAMHWFPDRNAAAVSMARAVRPGGVVGILCSGSGSGGEPEFRAVLTGIDLPGAAEWDAGFDDVLIGITDMEGYLAHAGLDVQDVWMENRIRRTSVEAYLERMRVVASHIFADKLSPGQLAELLGAVEAGMTAASGPRGFEYQFAKLFAVARRPG
jgi:SAM-dependent methyltransferase